MDAFDFAFLPVIAYIVLQPMALWILRGHWNTMARIPLICAALALGWTLLAFAGESDIWPLPFLFFAPLGTVYLVVLMALRGVVTAWTVFRA